MSANNQNIIAFHAIAAALQAGTARGKLIYSKINPRIEELIQLAKEQGAKVRKTSVNELNNIAGSENKGAVLIISREKTRLKTNNDIRAFIENKDDALSLVIILDGITDPQNLGAIIRSADQFGASCVIVPSARSASASSAVDSSSAGANQYMPLFAVANIANAIEILKKNDYWVYGADMGGKTAVTINLNGKIALVIGSEGKGLHNLTRKKCDELISIPCSGNIDSLNASVSAGILMYEVRRQQNFNYS